MLKLLWNVYRMRRKHRDNHCRNHALLPNLDCIVGWVDVDREGETFRWSITWSDILWNIQGGVR